ncbi:SPOR domain-containing protein [Morganella morganii]|uniref:SPOR domain-containing protein n=1 Tax=Morganella morganii TaxID=582 RepID=UPI001BDA96F1|nr:SPOR domain-containing protein [Morganella morganii]MBT0318410.1 SEL1-like repeat protein [Morganella morganii subsp. morganii]
MTAKLYHSCICCLLPGCLSLSTGAAMAGGESVVSHPIFLRPAEIPSWLQYQTGVAYINSEGVKQNIELGRYWIHQAARQNVPLAQYNLGVMFYDGIGGEWNPGCALWWLQRARNQQQDSDVQLMAEQALSALASEARSQPKIYRAPVLSDCDRLPAVYGADASTAEEVAVSRTEKFRRQWHTAAASLIQRFRDVITAFEEKSLLSGSAGAVTWATLSAEKKEELPGVVTGKHAVSYLPAELPETGEPELSENTIRTQELPVPLQEPPQKEKVTQEIRSQKEQITGGSLSTAPGKHFTVQLTSAATPEGLYTSATRYHLKNYLVYETVRHNQPWYVLVAGEYPTRQAAFQAITGLPHEFQKNRAWVRSLRQVKSELVRLIP